MRKALSYEADRGSLAKFFVNFAWLNWFSWSLPLAATFDMEGHDAQGQTAASAMDQEAIKQVKRLLDGKDASDVAAWGHHVDDTYPGVARMHFQVHDDSSGQQHCGPIETIAGRCEDGICLLNAIKHFYGKILQHEGRKISYPTIDYSKMHPDLQFSDVDAIKMLINLIGDLHQPLHVGYSSDDSGNRIRVKFKNKEMTLYELWDKGITEYVREHQPNFWYGGWTHVNNVRNEHETDKQYWSEEHPYKSFERWMNESVRFACEKAYVHPSTGRKLAGLGSDIQKVIDIDDGDVSKWKDLVLHQILMAGQRTAIVLNDILDAKGVKKLSDKTKLKTEDDFEKERELKQLEKERRNNPKIAKVPMLNTGALMTNLLIAAVTVPVWLLIVTHGLDPQSWYQKILGILTFNDNGVHPPRHGKRLD